MLVVVPVQEGPTAVAKPLDKLLSDVLVGHNRNRHLYRLYKHLHEGAHKFDMAGAYHPASIRPLPSSLLEHLSDVFVVLHDWADMVVGAAVFAHCLG